MSTLTDRPPSGDSNASTAVEQPAHGLKSQTPVTEKSGSPMNEKGTDVKKVDEKTGEDESRVRVRDADADTEAGSTIESKRLSWVQAAFLLFGEYIVIAILSFASSYQVLGMAGGLISTGVVGGATLWTSHFLWRYCMQHPETHDIVSLGAVLFGRKGKPSRIAGELTTIGLVLNNTFIMGLHILAGSIALNTISEHATCTIVWSAILLCVMFAFSLSRELKRVALYSMVAAGTMLLALILCLAFAGAESGPAGYDPADPPTIRAFAAPGTTFVIGFNALLNMYAWPEDFPKALYACTFAEIILFSIGGSILYWKFGDQYVTSPAYGALQPLYAKIVAAFTLPTIIVVGILYATITARVLYYRIFGATSVHVQHVTKKGTVVWVSIIAALWIAAFIIGEAIPFFNDLLALMSSLFDSWFGFIFWGVAYFRMYGKGSFSGRWRAVEGVFAALMIITGAFVLPAGVYTSVEAINMSYASGEVAGAFTCQSNGFTG